MLEGRKGWGARAPGGSRTSSQVASVHRLCSPHLGPGLRWVSQRAGQAAGDPRWELVSPGHAGQAGPAATLAPHRGDTWEEAPRNVSQSAARQVVWPPGDCWGWAVPSPFVLEEAEIKAAVHGTQALGTSGQQRMCVQSHCFFLVLFCFCFCGAGVLCVPGRHCASQLHLQPLLNFF